MNLLTIGLIGTGIYFLSQSNSKSINQKRTQLPNEYFENLPYSTIIYKDLPIPIDLVNGKIIKTSYYKDSLSDEVIYDDFFDQNILNHNFLIFFLHIKENKISEGLKYLYEKDYKLINEIYQDYLIGWVTKWKNKSNSYGQAAINYLPGILNQYFEYLKKAGVPEDKWPGQELKGI